jgi:hypothetical protein
MTRLDKTVDKLHPAILTHRRRFSRKFQVWAFLGIAGSSTLAPSTTQPFEQPCSFAAVMSHAECAQLPKLRRFRAGHVGLFRYALARLTMWSPPTDAISPRRRPRRDLPLVAHQEGVPEFLVRSLLVRARGAGAGALLVLWAWSFRLESYRRGTR